MFSYLAYCLFVLLGTALVFLGPGNRDFRLPVPLFNAFFLGFVGYGYMAGALLYGFSIQIALLILSSFLLFNISSGGFLFKYKSVIRFSPVEGLAPLAAFAGCLLGILLGILYFYKIGYIPLLSASSPTERIAAMSGNGSLLQPMRFVPLCAMALLLLRRYVFWAWLFFLLGQVLLLGTGFRGVFFQNILLLIILLMFIVDRRFGVKDALLLIMILLPFIVAIGVLRGDGSQLGNLVVKVAHTISVSTYILGLVVNHFEGIYWGATFFFKYSSILPIESVEYTQWLTTQLPINFSGGVTPTIVGDFYINFSWFAPLGFFVLGIFLNRLQYCCVSKSLNAMYFYALIIISMGVARSCTGGISNTLFQTSLSVVLCVILFFFSRITVGSNSQFGSNIK